MSQYGITKIGLDAADDSIGQVLLHAFKPHLNPERADVELEAGVPTPAAAVAALIAAGNEVYVMDEVAPRLTDEADAVGIDEQGRLHSFDRLGRPSGALRALPRLDLH